MGVRPAGLSAIASAATLTSPTRLPQPLPNTGQVFSDCRKRMRSSQMARMSARASRSRAAASVVSSMRPVTGASSTRCSTFGARPVPELTA